MSTQQTVQTYVEEKLTALGLTLEDAANRQGIPLEVLKAFLRDPYSVSYAEQIRVVVMLGSLLGSPVCLARQIGVDVEE